MTNQELKIYHQASAATIQGNRKALALALRQAKNKTIHHAQYGEVPFQKIIVWHCNFIGWPIKLRPNGRHS